MSNYFKDKEFSAEILNEEKHKEIFENIVKEYPEELGKHFNIKKFWNWYNNSKQRFFIVYHYNNPIGYVSFKDIRKYRFYNYIKNYNDENNTLHNHYMIEIYLDKKYIGQGYGKFVLNCAINEEFKIFNYEALYMSIYDFNKLSINFALKLEFKLIGKFENVCLFMKSSNN